MKKFTRFVCLLLVIGMLIPMQAYAVGEDSQRGSAFFDCSAAFLYEITTYTFEAWFSVTTVSTMEELGASMIKIQRSLDGENWTTTKTFTKEDYPSLIREDKVSHASCIRYTGTKGYYYRAYIELYAKNSTGTAYWPRYTSAILIGG